MRVAVTGWMKLILIFSAVSLVLSACDSSNSDPDDDEPQGLIWSYKGNTGPANWASLSSDFALCGSGTSQSPIDILDDPIDDAPGWSFNWGASTLKMLNDGVQVHILYRPGSTISVDGELYTLQSFHIHTPGEHTYQGNEFEAEFHFVHKNDSGDFAVVAVWAAEGIENKNLSPLLANMPRLENEEFDDPSKFVRAEDFLPESLDYFRYSGSLSEPPCSEGVHWIVLQDSIGISAAQLLTLDTILGSNSRPIQALNGRAVVQK